MADLLIVDDDWDIADLLAMLVDEQGHAHRIAHNGKEGLELIFERTPDLVLLDLDMPIMNGQEMAYILFVRNCGMEKIPLVLLSGNVELTRMAERIGTPYYLAKPYPADALLQIVERALQEKTPPSPKKEAVSRGPQNSSGTCQK
jgi:DNA-binding NtrC family response regulator